MMTRAQTRNHRNFRSLFGRTAGHVAAGNDVLRRFGCSTDQGRVKLSSMVADHPLCKKIVDSVRYYNDFNNENDPYGERSYGQFDMGGETWCFKIDYLIGNSQFRINPYLAEDFFRLLTIMHVTEC